MNKINNIKLPNTKETSNYNDKMNGYSQENSSDNSQFYRFKDTSRINTKAHKRFYLHWEFWIILILAILSVAPIGSKTNLNWSFGSSKTSKSDSSSKDDSSLEDVIKEVKNFADDGMSEHETYKFLTGDSFNYRKETVKKAIKEANIDWNQVALKSANNYLGDTSAKSKDGIYKLLTFKDGSKFTSSQAKYAVEHIKADWNKMALKCAQNYVKLDSFSDSEKGLYNLLSSKKYEGFTSSQANYAIKHVKVDWNKLALQKAREYQNITHSAKETKKWMMDDREPFSDQQIEYAISHLK